MTTERPHAIHSCRINRFRGLHGVDLESLTRFNLIVGETYRGLTSVLEALALHCDPLNYRRWLELADMREVRSADSLLERLAWLFPQGRRSEGSSSTRTTRSISLEASGESLPASVLASCAEEWIEMEDEAVPRRLLSIQVTAGNDGMRETLVFGAHQVLRAPRKDRPRLNAYLLAMHAALQGSLRPRLWTQVIQSDLKMEVLDLLRKSEPKLLAVDNVVDGAGLPMVRATHADLGVVPFSVLGQELSALLTLFAAATAAAGGVLLVDMSEWGLSPQGLRGGIEGLSSLCGRLQTQVIVATRSPAIVAAFAQVSRRGDALALYRLEADTAACRVSRYSEVDLFWGDVRRAQ